MFGFLLTLNPTYNDLIKHILRSEKLPTLENVCAQIQKEKKSLGLFGGIGDIFIANLAERIQDNKVMYKHEQKKVFCDHCRKKGQAKDMWDPSSTS